MKFELLNDEEFMEFVNTRPEKNFFQTVMMKERLEGIGVKVYLVGVKKNKKIVAASLIAETGHSFMGKKSYEAYKGFILDYHDEELVKFMTEEVKKFLQEKNALRLIIDPYIVNVSRDGEGNIVDGEDNRGVATYLKTLGYKEYKDSAQVTWVYCLDINGKSSDEIFKSIRSSARTKINRTINKFELSIRKVEYDELGEFKKITMDTCERKGFADRTLEYYQGMYKSFGDLVSFYICELDTKKYRDKLLSDIEDIENKLNDTSVELKEKKKKEYETELENVRKSLEELNEISKEDKVIPLSAAMFSLYGDEVIYLFGGSYDEYMKYLGQYLIQWEMISYAADHNYKRYNFFGIKGLDEPGALEDGVLKFKQNFNGYIEEMLGAFELSLSSSNKLYHFLSKIKRIVKK